MISHSDSGRLRPCFSGALLALLGFSTFGLGGETGERIRVRFIPADPDSREAPVKWLQARRLKGLPEVDGVAERTVWRDASEAKGMKGVSFAVGHAKGRLCVAFRAERPPREGDAVRILLDSLLDGATHHEVAYSFGKGLTTRSWAGRWVPWRPRARWAVAKSKEGWGFEVALSRRSLADPENAVIGFNVICAGSLAAAWAPTGKGGRGMGRLAFETRPVTVRAIRAGALAQGENRLRVTLGNPGKKRMCRFVVNVSDPRGGTWQRRYKLPCPAGRDLDLALGFMLAGEGDHRVDLVCFTPGLRRPCFIVTRRRVRPREALTPLKARLKGGETTVGVAWPFKPWEWPDMSLVVTLRRAAGGATLAHRRVKGLKGPGAEIDVSLAGMPVGDYEVRVSLLRGQALVTSRKWDVPIKGRAAR